jgi:hypothetical protein
VRGALLCRRCGANTRGSSNAGGGWDGMEHAVTCILCGVGLISADMDPPVVKGPVVKAGTMLKKTHTPQARELNERQQSYSIC